MNEATVSGIENTAQSQDGRPAAGQKAAAHRAAAFFGKEIMKTAIITGASRGVGRAVAETLARDGWRLILNCRSRFDLLEQVAERLRGVTEVDTVHGPITDEVLAALLGTPGTKPLPILTEEDLDGTQPESCAACEEQSDLVISHGPQDALTRRTRIETPEDALLLVNNAGISTFNLAQDVSDDELEEMLDANVKDMFRLTRAVIPYLLRASEGRILNMSSVWGVVGASMESVYSLTKGAVNAFTEALGKELAPNHIPVNAIAIGCVDTDMNGWMSAEDRAQLEDEIPYGRMCTAAEVADLVRLLAAAPAYLTGQIIRFDGGWI